MTYFLLIDGAQRGRYSEAQIKAMYDAGNVTADTLYWTEGMEAWTPVDELFRSRTPSSPPPLPAKPVGATSSAQNIGQGKQAANKLKVQAVLLIPISIVLGILLVPINETLVIVIPALGIGASFLLFFIARFTES